MISYKLQEKSPIKKVQGKAAFKKMQALNKKNGYVHLMFNDMEVSIDMSDTDGKFVYGLDNYDKDYEIDENPWS